jgi:hypothetical protein
MKYSATMNTPGYLPWSDEDPPVFDTPGEAWGHLADERRVQEDNAPFDDTSPTADTYSDTVDTLDAYASANHGEGTVYGDTPGHDSDHDLGVAYSVSVVEEPTGEDESGVTVKRIKEGALPLESLVEQWRKAAYQLTTVNTPTYDIGLGRGLKEAANELEDWITQNVITDND